MLKLRTILLCDWLYILILIIILITTFFRLNIPQSSYYKISDTKITGKILSQNISENKLTTTIKGKEKIIVIYYFKNSYEKRIYDKELGDIVKVDCTLEIPNKNTTENTFNYRVYLNHNHINYIAKANRIELIKKNTSIYYRIKNKIISHLENNAYLNTFIFGDKSQISDEVFSSYQENGISHLFAISGMHISLLSAIILKLLKKLKLSEKKLYFITSFLLIAYLLLTTKSPSIIRGVLFFILFSINKIYYFYIKPTNIFILTIVIVIFINPNYIYDIGFQYSFTISFFLISSKEYINDKNYLKSLLKTSLISFIASFPISLCHFYYINVLSIIYNLFFIPFISYVVFPVSLITAIFPKIIPLYNILTSILESLSLSLTKIKSFTITFPKIPLFIYFIYYPLLFLLIKGKHKRLVKAILIIILIIHYKYSALFNKDFIKFLDVNQGDSEILHINSKSILIDTGGKQTFERKTSTQKSSSSIIKTTTIPYLKSNGITKIDYLILTHGDYDHMGEAINLVNNFKVENVIFNCGTYNDLEQELIKVLDKNKIKHYSCIKELNIDKYKLQFLNTKEYDNENDNSNVIYFNYEGYKFLFMGDAGIEKEKDILEKYNLKNVDFLKVGHHGSNTSSSKYFINSINPNYSLISVGKNNRYGHPKEEVLETLKNSKIYRTDLDGSIEIRLNKSGYKIRTCPP